MQDVDHCVSKALAASDPKYTLFVPEDQSGVRYATECVRIKDRYVSVSWSFYDLEQKLIYKAGQNQSAVIKVDPRYTSQCCPVCGHIEKANRNKKTHLFTCKSCGYKSNLAVSEEYRRQGIASGFAEYALSVLKAEEINKVALLVFNYNETGNAFREDHGFTAGNDVTYRNKVLAEMVRIDT